MENKRSNVLISILLIVLCLSVCVGLTYAYFTDSAKSNGNKIQAGNLKLDLKLYDKVDDEWISIKNTEDPVFNYDKWEPGYVDAKLLKIENLGDLAMQWEAKLVSTEAVSAFANAIEVYVQKSNTEIAYPADRAAVLAWTKVGTLDQFINTAEKLASGTFTAQGEAYYIGIAFYMPAEITDNTLQGQVLGAFDIQINATQLPYESDLFGTDYDDGAKLPCGHYNTETIAGRDATCEDTGLTDGKKCSDCDVVIIPQVETPIGGHTESDWIIDVSAGEGTEGSRHTECTVCGEPMQQETIPSLPDTIFTWSLNDDQASYTVTGLKDSVEIPADLVIPSTYKGLPVTAIGQSAFLELGDTFESVTISEGIMHIGQWAFCRCSLRDFILPNSIITIGEGAFYEAGFSGMDLVIPDSVTTIGDSAFYQTSLRKLTIGNSVTAIGKEAFAYCEKLTEVTIGNSVTTIGDSAFYYCQGLTELTLGNSVTTIGESAFKDCFRLTGELIIPDSVTTIGNSAFYSCRSLTKLTIGNSVTTIGDEAFYDCYGLTGELIIPNSVTTIGDSAFQYCAGLTKLTIGNSVTTIGAEAFRGCGLTGKLIIPDSVTTISNNAFYGCSSLTSIDIPNSVTNIGIEAFSCCYGLTGELKIPDSVTTIGSWAFSGCSGLTSIEIPNSVTTIGDSAFSYCTGLTTVTIGSGVTTIGNSAFSSCYSLTSITFAGTVEQWNAISFGDSWKDNVPATEVVCSDGTVALN